MADAAKAAGVKHVIWSTLEDTRKWVPLNDDRMPTLHGKYKVPHFDGKGEANALFQASRRADYLAVDIVLLGQLHLLRHLGPRRTRTAISRSHSRWATRSFPGIAAEDIGKCALGVFKKPQEFIGKTVGIAGDHLTGEQMAAAMTKALGSKVVYNSVEPEVYRGFGFPGADDLGNMFQFKRDFEGYFVGARSLDVSRSLNPSLQSFDKWLEQNKNAIPLG